MTALRTEHDSGGLATPKTTVARALQDALDLIDDAMRRDGCLGMLDYVAGMKARGVTTLAAQDTLRFLRGTGVIVRTAVGDIRCADDTNEAPAAAAS